MCCVVNHWWRSTRFGKLDRNFIRDVEATAPIRSKNCQQFNVQTAGRWIDPFSVGLHKSCWPWQTVYEVIRSPNFQKKSCLQYLQIVLFLYFQIWDQSQHSLLISLSWLVIWNLLCSSGGRRRVEHETNVLHFASFCELLRQPLSISGLFAWPWRDEVS